MLVKIPETRNPFTVTLNGVEYAYQAGKEVDVPDAIGELILSAVKATDQLVEPDEVVPPFGSGDCSGGGVTSWNDLTDKPFYDEPILEDFKLGEDDDGYDINRLTFTAVDNGEGNGAYLVVETGTATADTPKRNATYIVEFDGTIYEVETTEDEIEYWGYIGNPSYYNFDAENNGLPFLFCAGDGMSSEPNWYLFTQTPGEHTIQIWRKTGENIKTLDLKYLPEQLQIGDELSETLIIKEGTYPNGHTFDQSDVIPTIELLKQGKIASAKVVYDGQTFYFPEGFQLGDNDGETVYYLGDFDLYDNASQGSGDYPFVFALGEYGSSRLRFSDEAPHTVSIYGYVAETVPIGKKYLPKADAVADVSAAPTAEEFNALLAALREAGYLAE